MAININSNIINNVKSSSIPDVYNRQSINKNSKELAKKPEIKEFNMSSVPSRELKDYLSEIEKRAISEIFDGKYVKSSLPEFQSNKVISVGSKLDIKL